MRMLRTLAVFLLATAFAACADAPTAPAPAAGAAPAFDEYTGPTVGQIHVSGVVDYGSYWRINLYTPDHYTIASRTWSHSGGTGQNPWGNGAYKYVIDRYRVDGPGCVFVQLATNWVAGGTSYDYEAIKVGGYTGSCDWPF